MIPGSIIQQEEDIHPTSHGPGRKLRGKKMSNEKLILPEKTPWKPPGGNSETGKKSHLLGAG